MNSLKRAAGKNSALIALVLIFLVASFLSPDFFLFAYDEKTKMNDIL